MLVSFSVANFLSFNELTTFSFESGRVTKKMEHLFKDDECNASLLKFVAMFGKNGAGKSNFVKAVSFLKTFVLSGLFPSDAVQSWCKVNELNEANLSEFGVKFIIDHTMYFYTVSVNLASGMLCKEELSYYRGNRKIMLFKKDGFEEDYKFSKTLEGENNDLKVLSRSFNMGGKPFLYSINHNTPGFFVANPQAKILQKVSKWFSETLEIIYPDQPIQETSLVQYELCLDEFSALLREFDTGIKEIRIEEVQKEKVFEALEPEAQQQLNFKLQFYAPIINQLVPKGITVEKKYSAVVRSRQDIFIITMNEDGVKYSVLRFVHVIGGKEVEFSMARESDGTHRLFQLLEILVSKKEKVYIMDEISRCLHPKLTIEFVKRYFEIAKSRNIQLLTTTHETRIMSHDIVRRDEVWIADSKDDGSTTLYSLEDKQVRIDKVLDENYMNNVWGGVPVFEDDEEVYKI